MIFSYNQHKYDGDIFWYDNAAKAQVRHSNHNIFDFQGPYVKDKNTVVTYLSDWYNCDGRCSRYYGLEGPIRLARLHRLVGGRGEGVKVEYPIEEFEIYQLLR